MKRGMTSVTLCTLALACQPAARPVDTATARASLMAVDAAYDSSTASSRTAGWVAYYADSGRMIDGAGNFLVGPAAIGSYMEPLLGDTTRSLRWAPDHAEVSGDGTLGYTWGRWTMTARDSTGARQVGQGRYITVWRRQPDGQWKVEADLGTDTR
ncbi:MAG TPA: nuclear transport factor 2 family protein [Gemmatimonadales bacterium]|nr:nuclear transport factor 2 family protein [Gemmatimonadales bacterium]